MTMMAAGDGTLSSSAMSSEPTPPQDSPVELQKAEDEASWIPLSEKQSVERNQSQSSVVVAPSTTLSTSKSQPSRRPSQQESLQAIQQKWETNTQLRKSFVNHPLDQSWGLFARHMAREIWQLDLHIRIGIVLVILGANLQILVFASRWYQPRFLFLLAVFSVSFFYLAPKDVGRQVQAFFQLISDPKDLVDHLNAAQLKRLFLASFLLPTVLEMRSFAFLSQVMADSGWRPNLTVAAMLVALLLYQKTCYHVSPRDCIQQGILLLYGAALCVTIIRADLGRFPALAGPFFLSTGTLLIFYRDDDMSWLTRALRHALRLTLRDVLASVGQSVQEDEMLRLAMLRWIVDYWSSTPPSEITTDSGPTSTPPSSTATGGMGQAGSHDGRGESATGSGPTNTSHAQGLQWEELSPMLDMTTDQMLEEVPSNSQHTTTSTVAAQLSLSNAQENQSLISLKTMLESMDVDDRAKPAVMAYKQGVESFPPARNTAVWLSIIRRCPATLVLVYRYLIDSGLAFASTPILLSFAVMEAFRVLQWSEACQRCHDENTADTAEASPESAASNIVSIPNRMDPMSILISGDDFSLLQPPALLQVWQNVLSSVTALEMGLTAARCVHTTAAAADFAGNIISLAQFGVEVSQRGLGHGIAVVAKELVHMHANRDAPEQTRGHNPNIRYTSAAVGAIRSSQIVARNVQALAEDEHAHPAFQHVAGAVTFLAGLGGLHKKDSERSQIETGGSSTLEGDKLTIEELVDENETARTESKDTPTTETHAQASPASDHVDEGKTDDYSELMELIAAASEKELITEAEKNSFMESLVVSRNTEDPSASQSAHDGIKKSLECLLLQSKEMELAGHGDADNYDRPMKGAEASAEGNDVDHLDHSMSSPGRSFESITALATESESPTRSDVTGSEAEQERPDISTNDTAVGREAGESIDSRSPDSARLSLLSVSPDPSARDTETPGRSDDSEVPPQSPHHAQSDQPLMPDSEEVKDSQDGTLVPSERGGNLSRGADLSPAAVRSTGQADASAQRSTTDENDVGKWIGGGLAVLGAVVGGIALAGAHAQGRQERSERDSQGREASTVTIEELDEDADEWVSVPASGSHRIEEQSGSSTNSKTSE